MPTKPPAVPPPPQNIPQPTPFGNTLSLRELTEVLIKHNDIHEGRFDLLIEFQIGIGNMAQPNGPLPSAIVGISKIGLAHSQIESPNTVDAAVANPKPKAAGKRKTVAEAVAAYGSSTAKVPTKSRTKK